MNKYQIRLLLIQHLSHSNQQSRGQLIESLVGQHQIEIMIRRDREKSQYLVQNTPMLRGHADTQVQSAAPSQFGDHRRHLDGLRPRAENSNHLLHNVPIGDGSGRTPIAGAAWFTALAHRYTNAMNSNRGVPCDLKGRRTTMYRKIKYMTGI